MLRKMLLVVGTWALIVGGAMADESGAARYATVAKAGVEVLVDSHLNGSGWLAPEPGHAFTAAHVVAKKFDKLELRLSDGRVLPAKVIGRDPRHDAALLRIEGPPGELPAGLPFADKLPTPGDGLWVYGAPQYRHAVMLPGTMARASLTNEWLDVLGRAIECVHVSGVAPKGMSGGPWVDGQGRVVGLQSGGMTYRDAFCGISFVTPAAALARLLEEKRNIPSALFGAATEELDEQATAEIRRFPAGTNGLVLKSVAKDGPAARAGLASGMLMRKCGDKEFRTRDDFYQFLASLAPGTELACEVLSPGQPKGKQVKVKLAE